MARGNPYTSKRLSYVSRKKTTVDDRNQLKAFRKENKKNLYRGDIDEMYNDSLKYKNRAWKSDNKYMKKTGVYR